MFTFECVNNCMFVGRLGRDIESKFLQSGTAVASFTVAVKKYNPSTKKNDDVEWINCDSFDKQITETAVKYAHKGDLVLVRGEFNSRQYNDKEGETKTVWTLKVHELVKLSEGKNKGEQPQAATTSAPASAPAAQPTSAPANTDGFDEDIPF